MYGNTLRTHVPKLSALPLVLAMACAGAQVGGSGNLYGPRTAHTAVRIEVAKHAALSSPEKDALVDQSVYTQLTQYPDLKVLTGPNAVKKIAIISAPLMIYYDHNNFFGNSAEEVTYRGNLKITTTQELGNISGEQRQALAGRLVEQWAAALKAAGYEVIPQDKVLSSKVYAEQGNPTAAPSLPATLNAGVRENPQYVHPKGFRDLGMIATNFALNHEWWDSLAKDLGTDSFLLISTTVEWNLSGARLIPTATLVVNYGKWIAAGAKIYGAKVSAPPISVIMHRGVDATVQVQKVEGDTKTTTSGSTTYTEKTTGTFNVQQPVLAAGALATDLMSRAVGLRLPK